MKVALKGILFGFILSCFFLSCKKEKEIPPVPLIEYKDFVKFGNDSAIFSFKFKDGDGDIGLGQNDTTGIFASGSKYSNNLFMKYFYKDLSGNFVPYDTSAFTPAFDTLFFVYRIPDITPLGQNKILDGEINVNIQAPYAYPAHQFIRFEAFIYDRALHRSNVITTAEIQMF